MPTKWEDHRDRAHALQGELFSEMCSTIEGLADSDWQRSTNCPGWLVRDIVAHVARSGSTFAATVDTGMRGETTSCMYEMYLTMKAEHSAYLTTFDSLCRHWPKVG